MECAKCRQTITEGAKFCPYCGEKVSQGTPGEDKPLYLADVKGLLKSGKLAVYRDRAEFVTSSVQKTIFNYSALIAVKKGLDRINFITEDGRTESCAVSMKNIHEAFLYIDQASRPYIEERKQRLLSQGIRYSLISSQGLTGGILNLMNDRAEFKAKSGQSEVISFRDVKSVSLSMSGGLEFLLFNGWARAYGVEKELREEVLAFTQQAVVPFLEERKAALLARGIYYSFPNSQGGGTLDILSDRAEFTLTPGQSERFLFKDVRAVSLSSGTLELSMTSGASRSFPIERDVCGEVLSFIENAIQPYVTARTVDFDTAFGVDERIEVNEKRGVFHIIRQGGREITDETPIGDVVKCEWKEGGMSGGTLGSVLSGGMSFLNSAAGAVGVQGAPDDKIGSLDVFLTIRAGEDIRTERVRFGDFLLLGMSRTNKKYDRYLAEISRFTDYLGGVCPACEFVVPALPVSVSEVTEAPAAEETALPAPAEAVPPIVSAAERDRFGITKYIEGVSGFIHDCATPMTIAIQGNLGNGKNSMMNLLFSQLAAADPESLVWFHTWQFSQPDLESGQLPALVENRLIGQLGGTDGDAAKDRAIKVAKGLINITSGFISQGSTDGQNFTEALFKDHATDSVEKRTRLFSELVARRTAAGGGKVIIFIDDLDQLAPTRAVELLEAMKNFLRCEGCVFVIAVDYASILQGTQERYGFDESRGKSFFDSLFQISFRVPASGYNLQLYVNDKLERIKITPGDEAELNFYVDLIKHSVGCEPQSMDRLFDSFLLIKNMAGTALNQDRDRRLMLFALLCMQTAFHSLYDAVVRMKDRISPELLAELCSDRSEILRSLPFSDEKRAEILQFTRVFSDIINTDNQGGISDEECQVFAEVLDFSSITSI